MVDHHRDGGTGGRRPPAPPPVPADLLVPRPPPPAPITQAPRSAARIWLAAAGLVTAAVLAVVVAELAGDGSNANPEAEAAILEVLEISLGAGAGTSDADNSCMAQELYDANGPGILVEIVESSLGADLISADVLGIGLQMARAAAACDVDLPDLEQGFSYGDNPVLDELQDECLGGSGRSCDLLYHQSDLGSDYERIGETCGERFTLLTAPLICEGNI